MMKHTDNNNFKYNEFFKIINKDRINYNNMIQRKYDGLYKFSSFIGNYLIFYTYFDYLMEFEQHNQYNQQSPFSNTQFGKSPIQNELDRIYDSIKNRSPRRLKIIGNVYNFTTGIIEYELEDGTYIPKVPPHNTKEIIDINIIPIDFVRAYDNTKFRNDVIENILRDE